MGAPSIDRMLQEIADRYREAETKITPTFRYREVENSPGYPVGYAVRSHDDLGWLLRKLGLIDE